MCIRARKFANLRIINQGTYGKVRDSEKSVCRMQSFI